MAQITNKDIRRLANLAEAQGWTVTMRRAGHIRFQSPSGGLVFSSATPSDNRSTKNLTAQLRRLGLDTKGKS